MTEMETLRRVLHALGPVAVAVSGGIDSLTLATIAHRALGGATVTMHHATSPAVPAEATERTHALAAAEGWRLDVFDAGEFEDAAYRANPANRCFFCKTNLYRAVARRTASTIASGTNIDDLSDWRPGLDAARDHAVRHPFVEAGISKSTVRALARAAGLGALSELPAAPCLSSRIETGLRIEAAELAAIHAAEQLVTRRLQPGTVRCRLRAAAVVIELDPASLSALPDILRDELSRDVAGMMARAGVTRPVSFAPYRTGSAFLRPPSFLPTRAA